MRPSFLAAVGGAAFWLSGGLAAVVSVSANITLISDKNQAIESDWTTTYYSSRNPLILGNNGGASTGGFHAWSVDRPGSKGKHISPGRTKLVTTAYGVGGKDVAVTIAQTDSVLRVFELPSLREVKAAQRKELGDWSALCPWKRSGNQYFFLFGKQQGVQFLLRENKKTLELVKVRSFAVPFEASACAISEAHSALYLSPSDSKDVYTFTVTESIQVPALVKLFEADEEVTGLAVYHGNAKADELLFVTHEEEISVYRDQTSKAATMALEGHEDVEIQGPAIYQGRTKEYPGGLLAFALEADDTAGFGVISLEPLLRAVQVKPNTRYDPRHSGNHDDGAVCKRCSNNGYCSGSSSCSCFLGFSGPKCQRNTCTNNCSGHGRCVGPDICQCDQGWGGLHCSFVVVTPEFETAAYGDDGDDPAIWIHPNKATPELSRIITTVKAGESAGLGVFDLSGNMMQTIRAGEPNNVDVIYGFDVRGRKTDLAVAACREDDTICLFEIAANGTLREIQGGSHPVVDDFSVYGSCVYRSRKTGKQYIFVNEKSARYLQYELGVDAQGALTVTLVRDFTGGSGGQVEGCVTDEANGVIFIGEEPSALWKYPAEPDSTEPGVAIARVGDGILHADVEGVTLVEGPTEQKGFIIVSCQGVSGYNIYRRAAPHEFVATFTISGNGVVDSVSNTDGIAAVGTALGPRYPHGLLVVHDDANELAQGGTSPEVSFKLISLANVLGAEGLKELELLADVSADWDPRAYT
ncbi:phytase [Triangularia verruculosa]|uniref:Phytase n=1 Tax=Triangularia verruculosa TaxID=2587418 RepID=A0AAN6XJY9_9PEZI|nr:phytase [Triangularia verruculosa]